MEAEETRHIRTSYHSEQASVYHTAVVQLARRKWIDKVPEPGDLYNFDVLGGGIPTLSCIPNWLGRCSCSEVGH